MPDDGGAIPAPADAAPPAQGAVYRDPDLPRPPDPWEGSIAALWVSSSVAPVCATAIAVLVYPLLPSQQGSSPAVPQLPAAALVAAILITFLLWLMVIRLLAPLMSAQKSQPRFYTELIERYQQLRDRIAQLDSVPARDLIEARTQLDYARRSLVGEDSAPALRWALAHGYISVLRALHRVEEALFLVEPVEAVLGDAVHDELSLDQSTIATRDALRTQIAAAKTALLAAPTSGAARPIGSNPPAGTQPAPPSPDGALSERQARETLRSVRNAINAFRDDARNGVIRARNQLLVVMLVVSLATLALVGLGEAIGVPTVYLTSAAALYLVGAIVGCFNRLRIEAKRSSAGEDFGLFQSRLLATLLMSGLAAVGGVYLVAALPSLISVRNAALPVPHLSMIFDLTSNEGSLLYAAIFGFAPETLTSLLLQGADKLQTDLLSSRPANANN